MARDFQFYVDRATDRFNAGFATLAAQKEAIRDVNSAYDIQRQQIQNMCLDIPHAERTQAQDDLYFGLPDLHNWKPAHREMALNVFPEAAPIVEQIAQLVELRAAIKNAEIVRVERQANQRAEVIVKSIRDIMAQRKAQYARGLELHDLFNGLPVTVNVHYVVNQFGTEYLRSFYYMAGVLTPLNVIIAVLEAKAREVSNGNPS